VYYGAPPIANGSDWPCAYMLLYESEQFLQEAEKAEAAEASIKSNGK